MKSTHTHTHNPQVNHHNKPDVALFGFTSIHHAEYAARAIRKGGKDLYLCLIGDALLEVSTPDVASLNVNSNFHILEVVSCRG